MADPFSEMHHLVSQGYQRNFAGPNRRVITVIDARSGKVTEADRPIRKNFALPGYNARVSRTGVADSRLEDEFARLERPILDQIRRIAPTNCGPELGGAVVTLFALHLVRSRAFHGAHERVVEQVRREWIPEVAAKPEVRARYVAEFGEEPTDQAIMEIAERILREDAEANRLQVDGMVRQYNKILEQFSKFYVQVITSDQVITSGQKTLGFALGDIPVVHANIKAGLYGFRDGLAIGDADLIVGPLTRTTAAALTARPFPPASFKVKKQLQRLNGIFVRAAMREIACHPDDALELCRVCQNLDRLSPNRLFFGG